MAKSGGEFGRVAAGRKVGMGLIGATRRLGMGIKCTVTVISVTVISLLLCSCGRSLNSADPSQCWNPKLLRVKIGGVVFDLPKEVDAPDLKSYGALSDNEGRRRLGILDIMSEGYLKHSDYRMNCNQKDKVPIEYGDEAEAGLHYGLNLPTAATIKKFNPKMGYVTPLSAIDQLHYVGVQAGKPPYIDPRYPNNTHFIELKYEFESEGHKVYINCDGFYPTKWSHWSLNGCIRGSMAIKLDNVVLFVEPNYIYDKKPLENTTGHENYGYDIPPQDWIKQWAFVANKIASYRVVEGKGSVQ